MQLSSFFCLAAVFWGDLSNLFDTAGQLEYPTIISFLVRNYQHHPSGYNFQQPFQNGSENIFDGLIQKWPELAGKGMFGNLYAHIQIVIA